MKMMLLLLHIILLAACRGYTQLVCPPGAFCAAEYPVAVADTCGVFLSNGSSVGGNNMTPVNNTWTNATDGSDTTLYDTLITQSVKIYSQIDQGFIDGGGSCSAGNGAIKTELPSDRNQTCGELPDLSDLVPLLEAKWNYIHYGKTADNPADSCYGILQHNSGSPSGMYWLRSATGAAVQVYCDMEGTQCDHIGWTRVVKVNLTDPDYRNCLSSSFQIYTVSGKPTICRKVQYQGGCVSAYLNVQGLNYSLVCGKVRGYQLGTTDSFSRGGNTVNLTPDDNYVDGISITYGTNPRSHIFTYASGCSESGSCAPASRCPCQTGATSQFPKFLGYSDFYCESGSYWHPSHAGFYSEPLWDGLNCDWKEAPCCTSSRLPWFYRQLPVTTSSNIEFRLCTAGNKGNEDVGFDQVEIYIK